MDGKKRGERKKKPIESPETSHNQEPTTLTVLLHQLSAACSPIVYHSFAGHPPLIRPSERVATRPTTQNTHEPRPTTVAARLLVAHPSGRCHRRRLLLVSRHRHHRVNDSNVLIHLTLSLFDLKRSYEGTV
ncbi:unnamed protein product [Citrullus colocynthis]|uniref:Uncharacterized protein n=1 Tax=Citrullus colocynthis TaxID=252529 RepID=A0ABP0YPL6_9ROSI